MAKRRMHPMCVTCLVKKQQEAAAVFGGSAQQQLEYMQLVTGTVAESCLTDSPSLVLYKITERAKSFMPKEDLFFEEKRKFNELLLVRQEELYKRIKSSDDPLFTALMLSMTGNYIDNGTVKDINEETLYRIMFDFNALHCDTGEYEKTAERIRSSRRITVLHDNCGEVVLDKLLLRCIKEMRPDKELISVVRGGPVLNDVTVTEARQVGLDEYARIVSSGKAIAGTEIEYLSPEAKEAVFGADLIIAKGQGNFETMCGCGLPVVYLFLCKCPLQCRKFGCEPLTGMMRAEDGQSLFDTVE